MPNSEHTECQEGHQRPDSIDAEVDALLKELREMDDDDNTPAVRTSVQPAQPATPVPSVTPVHQPGDHTAKDAEELLQDLDEMEVEFQQVESGQLRRQVQRKKAQTDLTLLSQGPGAQDKKDAKSSGSLDDVRFTTKSKTATKEAPVKQCASDTKVCNESVAYDSTELDKKRIILDRVAEFESNLTRWDSLDDLLDSTQYEESERAVTQFSPSCNTFSEEGDDWSDNSSCYSVVSAVYKRPPNLPVIDSRSYTICKADPATIYAVRANPDDVEIISSSSSSCRVEDEGFTSFAPFYDDAVGTPVIPQKKAGLFKRFRRAVRRFFTRHFGAKPNQVHPM